MNFFFSRMAQTGFFDLIVLLWGLTGFTLDWALAFKIQGKCDAWRGFIRFILIQQHLQHAVHPSFVLVAW